MDSKQNLSCKDIKTFIAAKIFWNENKKDIDTKYSQLLTDNVSNYGYFPTSNRFKLIINILQHFYGKKVKMDLITNKTKNWVDYAEQTAKRTISAMIPDVKEMNDARTEHNKIDIQWNEKYIKTITTETTFTSIKRGIARLIKKYESQNEMDIDNDDDDDDDNDNNDNHNNSHV